MECWLNLRNSVYSVAQVNKYIKNMFQNDYLLNNLDIQGEISNLKYHSSGHVYFTLKDEKSAIKCVMFASYKAGLKFRLEEGMQVIVTGTADVYERDGSYQIYAKAIKKTGVGNLFEEYEKLKAKLMEEGMFDPSYKRPIPQYVKTLGVVTAPTGAAVRDIIDVSKRRNPGIQIVLFPAIVQGAEAPASIVQGIEALNDYGVDVIICGRGGGSIEDLWGFNDETVARTIFNSGVPVISAVGHETDFTIADFAADLRAPTPSAAAELAVCDVRSILLDIDARRERLLRDMNNILSLSRQSARHFYEKLELLNPKNRLLHNKELLRNYKSLLNKDMSIILSEYKHRLSRNAGRLQDLSPLTKLSSGYSYVSDKSGAAVKSIYAVKPGDTLKINVTDGSILATVTDTEGADGR